MVIAVPDFAGENVAVFGLGRSGLSVARALLAGGSRVVAWDDGEAARAKAKAEGLTLEDLTQRDWSDLSALVLAPGVPLTHPRPHRVVQLATLSQTPIIGDIELFGRAVQAAPAPRRPKVAAVTGTNGKSTITTLLGHVVKACGRDAQVGGNIGEPALDLDPFHAGAVYVLETSSFQLELTHTFAPDVALLSNVTPDHLDRHGDMDSYVAAKRRIFAHQTPDQHAIIAVDDPITLNEATQLRTRDRGPMLTLVSGARVISDGVYVAGGVLYDALDGAARDVVDLRGAHALLGRHNWQNAALVYAAARRLGFDRDKAAAALLSFPGLAHRMEPVGAVGSVRFVNDSKATNTDAVLQALSAFDRVYWIAGGRAKGGGFADLAPVLSRVAKAYLIGEAAEAMAAELTGRVPIEISRDMRTATANAARDAAESGDVDPVVLLAPACASFDQFANFEARGDAFRDLVGELRTRDAEPKAAG